MLGTSVIDMDMGYIRIEMKLRVNGMVESVLKGLALRLMARNMVGC